MISKIFWKTKNYVDYFHQKYILPETATGVLSHKEDDRDLTLELGAGTETLVENFTLDNGYRFNQNPFNICVFASRVLGFSMQNNIRFSTRWDVKVGKKLGYITRDGYSFLRAENEIGLKIGRLPYEYMPDETKGMTFKEYSRWTPEDDKLMEIAKKYRTSAYRAIPNKRDAIAAITAGYVLFTAGDWFSAMNHPIAPDYLLRRSGAYIGGHAYIGAGFRKWGDDIHDPQTFGPQYGIDGAAYIDELFGKGQYAVYVEEPLPLSTVLEFYQGKAIKSNTGAEIYEIFNGKKNHIKTMDEFSSKFQSFNLVSQSLIDKIPNL